MVASLPDKPAGILDQAIHTVFGPLLTLVQGHGYSMWFLLMALLHPLAWLLFKFGGITRPNTAIMHSA
jgi:hypothetical protein